jgi:hypothetical protein
MPKTRTIALSEPLGAIKKIVLREPRCADLSNLGMPAVWVSLPGGGFLQEMPVLYQWIERLADIDPDFLGALCLRDALAVRGAVLAFFFEAADQSLGSDEASSPTTI